MYTKQPLFANQFYHVYNRGINRESLFKEGRNYDHFLRLYVQHVHPAVFTYAYCLLPNHFHLLIRTRDFAQTSDFSQTSDFLEKSDVSPAPPFLNPNEQFRRCFIAYAKAINRAYERTGALFQHRFGRVPITNAAHLTHLVRYIHRNPQHHGLVSDFRNWRYSSYNTLLGQQPTRVARDNVLDWFGSRGDFADAHAVPSDESALVSLLGDCD